jgi:hypothetical protein
MKTKSILIVLLAVLLSLLLFGCGTKEIELTGADKDAVLAYSETKTDNLLSYMNENNYLFFSQDFDDAMLKAMSEAQFAVLKKDRDAKLGLYVSREVSSVLQSGDFYVVVYTAKFEKDDNVTVRVVFRAEDPHQISGLWFNK